MKYYTQDKLINSLTLLNGSEVIFLLGAGCSILSGCMPASKLVLEFKKRIYCAQHNIRYDDNALINDEKFNDLIQQEQPPQGANPYSYYFEKCFPSEQERTRFIKEKFESIKPSYGYLCFAEYLIEHQINYVLTTNFDKLCEKALYKLNDGYDFAVSSDSLSPNLATRLNLVKLHGDYIYDSLKNTEEELVALSNNITTEIQAINTSKIVVIGYSGQDQSVMNCLKNYLSSHPKTELAWCIVDENQMDNHVVNELLDMNSQSSYYLIDGFDDLFSRLYNCYGKRNDIIENLRAIIQHEDFVLSLQNQPEKLMFNCYPLQNHPNVYKIKYSLESSKLREINNADDESFIIQHKEYLYAVGTKGDILKKLDSSLMQCDIVDLCEQPIPLNKKCKLIKELIKIIARKNSFAVYKDNIFVDSNDVIKEGLHIHIDFFNGSICLFANVNYFSTNKTLSDSLKYKINSIKSNLYAQKNYNKLNEHLQKYFNKSLTFNYDISQLIFNNKAFGFRTDCIPFENYNCATEPIMIGDQFKSVNQIKIVTENGPRKTLFSGDSIRVGVFCAEENKLQLKSFLDQLVNGTKTSGTSLIPQYTGFTSIFHKKIEFIHDALPAIFASKLTNNSKVNFDVFAEMCVRGIAKMYNEKQIDIALIYIGDNFKKFRTDGNKDLHDYIKLRCVNRYKTQFLEEFTLKSSDNINKKLLNFAIGLYTKTIGMSWYPERYSKDTLFLGISFGIDSNGINVGCSQMFDGAGRGMQLIISKVTDKHRKNQYLSEDEAYRLGIKIRQTYYRTSKIDELKRIVIHRTDPFRAEEITGFKKAFEGIDDFDLIQISDFTTFNSYKFVNQVCFGYPLTRGTTVKASRDTIYVWSDGSINHIDINQGKTYRNNSRGMGKPLKVKKFYGKISANEVVDDLMYLTKMDFNSSDVIYSKLPVTIKYSRIVCNLLKQGDLNDELVSFEYVM